jgi:hypothetical protein
LLDGIRYPTMVNQEIDQIQSGAYTRISASDATGGDTDPNRYYSGLPGSGYESTHIFDFTIAEDPGLILDIGVLWEGYGDDCTQMELYVWDNVLDNWSNGAGLAGSNMYMDNFAGNLDRDLVGHIQSDFSNYIDNDGKLTLLLYAERANDRSFHDYISVTVTYADLLSSDLDSISASTGGTVNFSLTAGAKHAGRNYLMLGTMSGTEPGIPLPGGLATLPLNWDLFTNMVMNNINGPFFQDFMGTLDGNGEATAIFTMGAVPGAAGIILHFAYCMDKPWDFASNAVPIEIVP